MVIKLSRRKFLIGAGVTVGGALMVSRYVTRAPSVIQIRYRLRRLPDGVWTKPLSKTDVLTTLRERASKHRSPYRLRREDNDWGAWKEIDAIISRLREVLPKVPIGTRYRVQSKDGATWIIRKIEVNLSCRYDTQGTDAVDRIYCTVATRFRGVENWGICACRRVVGGSSWSQHAYCNAVDFHHDSRDIMKAIADFLVANAIALDVAEVIYDYRIWIRGSGWRSYDGASPHTDHIHVSGWPLKSGVPPCA